MFVANRGESYSSFKKFIFMTSLPDIYGKSIHFKNIVAKRSEFPFSINFEKKIKLRR